MAARALAKALRAFMPLILLTLLSSALLPRTRADGGDSHSVAKASERGFLFKGTDAPFVLGFDVYVPLFGLNADGAHTVRLDEQALGKSLLNSMPAGRPSCADRRTKLAVEYTMAYSAFHAQTEPLRRLESVRALSLLPVPHLAALLNSDSKAT